MSKDNNNNNKKIPSNSDECYKEFACLRHGDHYESNLEMKLSTFALNFSRQTKNNGACIFICTKPLSDIIDPDLKNQEYNHIEVFYFQKKAATCERYCFVLNNVEVHDFYESVRIYQNRKNRWLFGSVSDTDNKGNKKPPMEMTQLVRNIIFDEAPQASSLASSSEETCDASQEKQPEKESSQRSALFLPYRSGSTENTRGCRGCPGLSCTIS